MRAHLIATLFIALADLPSTAQTIALGDLWKVLECPDTACFDTFADRKGYCYARTRDWTYSVMQEYTPCSTAQGLAVDTLRWDVTPLHGTRQGMIRGVSITTRSKALRDQYLSGLYAMGFKRNGITEEHGWYSNLDSYGSSDHPDYVLYSVAPDGKKWPKAMAKQWEIMISRYPAGTKIGED